MSNQSGWWRRLTWFLTAASPMKIQRTNAKFSPVISKPVTAVISYNLMALFHKIGHEMPTTAPNLFAFGNAKSFAFRGGIIVRHACGFAAFTAELQKQQQQHGPNHRGEGSTVLWNCWTSIDSYWSRKWLRIFHRIHIKTLAICSSRCPPISSHVRS